ncbi:restriction endonuclease subunit S [Levilactobacillus tangyuanensis]|uniref:Restriction endonuclease subunit S n=1 Tax=Levilactobacillus tangyuanensis TaxID=2486021 RepID=A0ABW1TMR2_9LACO|nr:restriction endonuclease subunit S [Levilactobacillus tangyuanensis]
MMEKKKQMNPRIRFKGFEDDWEQRKLGELTEQTIGGGTPSKKIRDFWQGDIPWIQSSNVQLEHLVLKKAEIKQFISKRALKESAAKLISKNSISIVTRVGVGKIAYVPFQYATSQDFLTLVGLRISPLFLLYKLYVMMPFMGEVAQGTSIKGVTKPELLVMKLNVPTKTIEQDKIGQILTEVDSLIAANEKNVGQLKLLKRLLLQKLFSVEWRFKGFKDHWEQRKLSYYLQVSRKKNLESLFKKTDVLSISGEYGVVNQIKFQGRSFAGKSVLSYGIVQHGDIVYTKSPLKKNPYGIIKTNSGVAGIVSTLYAVYNPLPTLYSPLIQYYFESNARLNNYLRPLVNKGAKNDMKVKNEDVLKGKVQLSSKLQEQHKIVSILLEIDSLIAANEDKLERLKQVKKFLMQNLFV